MATDQEKAAALRAAAATSSNPEQIASLLARADALDSVASGTSTPVTNDPAVKNLADVIYLSKNTGVSGEAYNNALENAGIDPNDSSAAMKAQTLLAQNGYAPDSNKNYYGNNTAEDIGAALLNERWQDAPEESELGEGQSVLKDNVAAALWLDQTLSMQGIDKTSTAATSGTAYSKFPSVSDYRNHRASSGRDTTKELDIFEWQSRPDKPKKPITQKPVSSTPVLNLGANQVAPINPNVPQTVVQQTPQINYQQPLSTGQMAANVQTAQQQDTGTFATPLQTAGLSAVPSNVAYKTQYAGTQGMVPTTLTATAPGTGQEYISGYRTVNYVNDLGQRIPVTEFNGSPTTYVPPGYVRETTVNTGYAEGGLISDAELEGKYRIYTKQFGYNGPKTRAALEQFEEARPEVKRKGMAIGGYVRKFNTGGYVQGYQPGGLVGTTGLSLLNQNNPDSTAVENTDFGSSEALEEANTTGLTRDQLAQMQASAVTQTMQPIQAPVSYIQPTAGEFIPVDAGMTVPMAPFAEAATVGTVQQAEMPTAMTPATADVTTAAPQVQAVTDAMQPVTGSVSPEAQITAAQQTSTAVSELQAEQGTAIMMDNPVQREIQDGELISAAANAEKAAEFTEQIQAATASPSDKATVQGQLEGLMAQFEGGETPAWAAGSMRKAMATLSARGLGASSLAGQAVIQAAMEAALPIAQMDAQTVAQFEAQNLSNRQQRAMLAAQQRATFLGQEFDQAFQARVANSARIGDIANMNFTAEQQVALENARAANTMELNNLSNRQAMVMAEAAALSQLDMANLNNRQQAAVQNAQNFLQMDMANLNNEQQTAIFKAQQNIQALFTDQAAENAAAQFNAQSENQTNQFFANLSNQTAQFNASQQNAMDQFNVNSVNALREFNSELQQQRDMFNAQNGLVIAQANAQWRQNIATLNTAAQNESNMDFAKTINGLTAANMDQIWQRERDIMSFAFAAAESAADRASNIAIAKLTAEEQAKLQDSIGKGKLTAIAFDAVVKKWLG